MTQPTPQPTEPASIGLDVHAVIERAAEIAAEEGHANITEANMVTAFEEIVK